ncbi:MAG: prepilin-type N-terminal cleavage/methylation domain-containing protein, partial [Frankiaceae bacterium]|nr:prepilin-type N-terminal cleavage/methylation domain-containing protein [Frankiaceae bacterium]MBV9368414.1 prepilin-type N-terminal cleavage/methylation domain-containing protein [Frankiales bacterium]
SRSRSADEGFTLIELLVVMIIIGILAGIAIPLFLSQRANARDTGVKSDLRSVAAQEEGYYTGGQSYGTFAQMVASGVSFNHLTPGDTISIFHLTSDAYCLKGTNAQSPNVWFYDSQGGGLQPKGSTDCSVTNTGAAGDSLSG